MAKHPEWNFAEVSKAISEGWKDVTMEEVERLEEEVFCLNERSKFKAKGKAYWTAFKLWSKRMRKEILEEHPAWTDYAVESALERKWKTVKKEEIDVLENQVTLLSENDDEQVEKGLGTFNAFLCWSIKKMKNIQLNIPNWSDIQIGKSITDGWQEIEKEEVEGLDFEAFCLNEKVNKRVKKKGKGQRKASIDTEENEDEADEEIGDDEEWDPFILKLKRISKFINKLETMEELPEQPEESTEEDEKDENEKSMEEETSGAQKEQETKDESNANVETSGIQENASHQNGNGQVDTEVKSDNIVIEGSNPLLENQALDSQIVTNNPSESTELKQQENGETVGEMNSEQETTVEELLQEPSESSDINMDTAKPDETISKDTMDKDSQPSLTQSTLDNDVLEEIFQEKSNDDNAADAIVNELPL